MSTLRISDAPLLPDVNGTEKIPTGGRGDYAISVDQIKDHIFQDVGKELVGLGNVDNTSDLDKPVSTAQQAALNLKADKTYVDTNLDLKADKTNVYTRSETSLALSKKADLVNGVVPENQIPSSFNDVLEFTTPNLPIIGESGKIYVTTDTNKTWRWATNKYVEISGWNPDSVSKRVTIPTYNNAVDGVEPVSGVADGAYFNVRSSSDDTMLVEYQNVGGSAVATGKSYPSGSYVNTIAEYTALPFKVGKSYALYERVQLENGDIVKSIVSGNTTDPNVDMTGWVSVGNGGEVESIADLLAINNPKDGAMVYVKSYSKPLYLLNTPYQGGNTFIYQSQYSHINDSVFIINGWVAQDQNLTFEKCGVVVNSPTDQSDAMNFAIRYAISSRIYHLTFETQGRVYIAATVEIPPVRLDEGGKYTHVYSTQLTLDTSNVTFESIASTNIEMFRVLRPKTKFTSLVINNDTYKRTGTGLRIGLTRADADRYPRAEYYTNDTGECQFDLIDFTYMKTGIVLQAGYHNYYNQFEKVKLNAVFFGIKFQKGADNNTEIIDGTTVTWDMSNTRCYIGNLVHTVGCLSLWLECCETLYVNNMCVEDISLSDYSDEMPTLNKMPTAVFISEQGTGNRVNNKNSIQKMMSEACHRVVENYGRYTNINVYAERWKDYPNGSPFVGKPFTNGFQESPVPQIKDLRNVDTYSLPVVTRGINITNEDYTANPSIATAFPSGTRIATELYGNVTYYPIASTGQVGNDRMEFLYSAYPENKFYHRRSNVSGSQNNPWIPLVERWGVGQNYLVHDATKTLDTLFVANSGFRSYQVGVSASAPTDVKNSLPRPSVGEFYGAVLAQSTSNDLQSGCLIAIGTYPKGIFIKFFGDQKWSQIQTVEVN